MGPLPEPGTSLCGVRPRSNSQHPLLLEAQGAKQRSRRAWPHQPRGCLVQTTRWHPVLWEDMAPNQLVGGLEFSPRLLPQTRSPSAINIYQLRTTSPRTRAFSRPPTGPTIE